MWLCELFFGAVIVDLSGLHMLSSVLSIFLQMTATIFMFFCVLNLSSLKTGSSVKIAAIGILYFFTLVILLSIGASALMDMSRGSHLKVGTSCLLQACLVHLCYGSIIAALYLRVRIKRASLAIF